MKTIESIQHTADIPYSLIVNIDGGDDTGNDDYIYTLYKEKKISSLIVNGGKNRGVGRAFNNCLALAEGEYIFKIDTDLVFHHNWLSTACSALDNNKDVGAISLFNYRHYDPVDTRFEITEERSDISIVNDFVSSVYGFRHKDLDKILPAQDDGNHTKLGKLAITKRDMVENQGFGVGKSVYVSGTMDHPFKTATYNEPLIFQV